jgi:hypothetical protein
MGQKAVVETVGGEKAVEVASHSAWAAQRQLESLEQVQRELASR